MNKLRSVVFDRLLTLLSTSCCLLYLHFCFGFEFFGSFLAFVSFDLLGCEFVDVAIGKAVLADRS